MEHRFGFAHPRGYQRQNLKSDGLVALLTRRYLQGTVPSKDRPTDECQRVGEIHRGKRRESRHSETKHPNKL